MSLDPRILHYFPDATWALIEPHFSEHGKKILSTVITFVEVSGSLSGAADAL